MRKIIEGRKYDTETATKVHCWYNDADGFDSVVETLYRKRNGEYFLHGEGGARTKYASPDGDGWCGGSMLIPLSYEGARSWMEEHADGDEYEAEFGETPEGDDDIVAVTIRISGAAKAMLQRECSKRGVTQGQLIADMLLDL